MNQPTKNLIKQINRLDCDPADALVALYYISTHYHNGMGDPLYAVANLTGFNPGYTSFDDEVESVKMVYEEIEASINEGKTSYHYDWIPMVKFYNRKFREREY